MKTQSIEEKDEKENKDWWRLLQQLSVSGKAKKIMHSFVKDVISQARREEREKVKDILVKLKEKDKGWTGFPPTPMRFGEYEKIQASKDFGYDKAIGDVLDQLKLKVKEEK